MVKRRRYDASSANSTGLSYLLRRLDRLESNPAITLGSESLDDDIHPIEPSFLVASSEAWSGIRKVADYKCSGVNDEVEIIAALARAVPHQRVVLSTGSFFIDTNTAAVIFDIGTDVSFIGSGMFATKLIYSESHLFDFRIRYGSGAEIGHFSIEQAVIEE